MITDRSGLLRPRAQDWPRACCLPCRSLPFDYETDPADDAENEDLALLVGLGAEF